jgi:hypothetical protein
MDRRLFAFALSVTSVTSCSNFGFLPLLGALVPWW